MLRVFRVQPLGHDQQLFADGQRLVILLPVVFPVLVLDIGQLHVQRAEVGRGVLRAQRGKLVLQMADGLRHGRALLQIQPDLREPLHLLLEPFVHIVPVLAVFLEKFVELILIVHDKAVKAEHGQPVAHKVDRPRRGLDGHFNPLHDDPPDFRSEIAILYLFYTKLRQITRGYCMRHEAAPPHQSPAATASPHRCESIVETEKKMTKGARREIVRCEQTDRTLLRDLPSQ